MSHLVTKENYRVDASLRKQLRNEIRAASSITWDWKQRVKVWLRMGPGATNRSLALALLSGVIASAILLASICAGIVAIEENIAHWMRHVNRFRSYVGGFSPGDIAVVRGSVISLLSFACFFGPSYHWFSTASDNYPRSDVSFRVYLYRHACLAMTVGLLASLLSGWLLGLHLAPSGWIVLIMTSNAQTLFAMSWATLGLLRRRDAWRDGIVFALFLGCATVLPALLTFVSLDTSPATLGYLSPGLREHFGWSIWLQIMAWPTLVIEAVRQGHWLLATAMLSSITYVVWRGIHSFTNLAQEHLTLSRDDIALSSRRILWKSEIPRPPLVGPSTKATDKDSAEEDVNRRIETLCRSPKTAWERSYHSLVRPAVWMEALIRDSLPKDIVGTTRKHLGDSKLSWQQRLGMLFAISGLGSLVAILAGIWAVIVFGLANEQDGIRLVFLSTLVVIATAGFGCAPCSRWKQRGGPLYPVSQTQNVIEISKLWLRNACLLSPLVVALSIAAAWRYPVAFDLSWCVLITAAFVAIGVFEIELLAASASPQKRSEMNLLILLFHAVMGCAGAFSVLMSSSMVAPEYRSLFDSENQFLLTLWSMRLVGYTILFAYGCCLVNKRLKDDGDILLPRPQNK